MFIDPPEGCKGMPINPDNVISYEKVKSVTKALLEFYTASSDVRFIWLFQTEEERDQGIVYFRERAANPLVQVMSGPPDAIKIHDERVDDVAPKEPEMFSALIDDELRGKDVIKRTASDIVEEALKQSRSGKIVGIIAIDSALEELRATVNQDYKPLMGAGYVPTLYGVPLFSATAHGYV